MSIKHFCLPTQQVTDPQSGEQITEPKYADTDLVNSNWVACYFNQNASVLIAAEANAALEGEDDVVSIDDLTATVSQDDADAMNSLAQPAQQAQIHLGKGQISEGGQVNQSPDAPTIDTTQTYKDALLSLAGLQSVTLKIGSTDASL